MRGARRSGRGEAPSGGNSERYETAAHADHPRTPLRDDLQIRRLRYPEHLRLSHLCHMYRNEENKSPYSPLSNFLLRASNQDHPQQFAQKTRLKPRGPMYDSSRLQPKQTGGLLGRSMPNSGRRHMNDKDEDEDDDDDSIFLLSK